MVAAQNSKAQFNSNIAFRTKAACCRAVLLLQRQGRTVCIRMSASHFDWRETCSHKLHSLAAAWASHVLAVMHWKVSPSHNAQGGPLGPETSPLAPYATIGLINGEAVVKWISFSSWLKHCAY